MIVQISNAAAPNPVHPWPRPERSAGSAQAVAPTPPVPPTSRLLAASEQQTEAAVREANRRMQQSTKDLVFSLDEKSGRSVIRLVDTQTGQVLRQFPTEEMLGIANALERMRSLLLDEQA